MDRSLTSKYTRSSMNYNPQIDSIFKRGTNGAGVLLLHGFTGTPDCMRSVVNELAQHGFTVSAPLLAGHGTTPEKLAQTDWKDWYHSAQKAYMELHAKCSKIFVAGLSMGGLLTLKLAINYPQSISAIACLATPLHLKGWIKALVPVVNKIPFNVWKYQKKMGVDVKDPVAAQNFWNYDRMPISNIKSILELQNLVRKSLAKIQTPILIIHSRHDTTAPYESMNQIASLVSSQVTETVTLENSQHIITIDFDKDLVATKTNQFFERFL